MKCRSVFGVVRGVAASLVVCAAFMSMVTGCGGSAAPVNKVAELNDDQKAIHGLVSGFADYASSAERVKSKFVKGKAPKPAEVKKYASSSFSVLGEIVVSGDTATAPVEIIKYDANGVGAPPKTQTWKFQKEGSDWKIVEAPAG